MGMGQCYKSKWSPFAIYTVFANIKYAGHMTSTRNLDLKLLKITYPKCICPKSMLFIILMHINILLPHVSDWRQLFYNNKPLQNEKSTHQSRCNYYNAVSRNNLLILQNQWSTIFEGKSREIKLVLLNYFPKSYLEIFELSWFYVNRCLNTLFRPPK